MHTSGASASAEVEADWSSASLRRLDPALRATVRRGDETRVAIKVFFRTNPNEDTLSELLLARAGTQVVGHVEMDTLRTIASRPDVDRIESLNDTGY